MSDFQNAYSRTVHILSRFPRTRDDKQYFCQKLLSESESIQLDHLASYDRNWRLAQRKNPNLRGKDFYERQKHARKIARIYAEG